MRYNQRTTASLGMLAIFIIASLSPLLGGQIGNVLQGNEEKSFTPVGQSVEISIPVYPNGSSSILKVEVPGGEALQELDLELQPRPLPIVEEFSWDTSAHFNTTAAVFDNVDYNKTGLTILPRGIEWDFENTNHGWTLSTGGGWARGYDTTLGSSNGVHGGSNALYTYNGNYPNYMSSTYWATSPTFDCSSCSGTWSLSYWKRLGVESSSWDHAYVQLKNSQGNWVNLWSNSGTVNDGSFSLSSHSVGSYINNNPSAQVRFGLGTTDGSVTYTGWNIDDVSILPMGGVSGGFANWTSPDFGPQAMTGVTSVPGAYGIFSVDAIVPSGASLKWTILDASTLSPIPGFLGRSEHVADLGIIDWETHPSLRLKLEFIAGSGGAPYVYSINLQGRVVDDFFANPSDDGWSMGGASWSSTDNRIYGTGSEVVFTPTFEVARPISRIRTDMVMSGSAQIEVSVNGGNWSGIEQTVTQPLNSSASSVRFKIFGGGSYWQLDRFEVDLQGAGMPMHPRIDIALDNRYEWEIPSGAHGLWGWQNRLGNGYLENKMTFPTPTSRQVSLLLPTAGIDALAFDLTPVGTATNNVTLDFSVGSTTIFSSILNTISKSTIVSVGGDELIQLNAALLNATASSSGEGYSMAILDLDITASGGSDLLLRGLRAPYSPTAIISADGDHQLVRAINEVIASQTGISGTKFIPIPLQSEMPTGYIARMARTTSSTAPNIISMSMTNVSQSESLTPSWQWIEVEVLFDTQEDAQRVELDFAAINKFASFHCTVGVVQPAASQGEMAGNCLGQGNYDLLEWHPQNPMLVTQNNTLIRVLWSFRFDSSWDDEDILDIRSSMVTVSGIHSLPRVLAFGSGLTKGMENDVNLEDWWVINQNGDRVPDTALFLSPGEVVDVVAKIGFEDVGDMWSPRSGDVEVSLWQSGVQLISTTILDEGLATMSAAVPSSGAFITWEVRLSGLNGQDVAYSVISNTFQTDSLAPEVVGMSIDRHDHISPSINQRIEFTIYDRPVLPQAINLHLWKQWIHDIDADGLPSAAEYAAYSIVLPGNLSASMGNYILNLDDTAAADGDLVAGYLTGADPAGNLLIGGGGGGSDQHLFMYQVLRDIAPNILSNEVYYDDGHHSWLHPETFYTLNVPLEEGNGISDLSSARIELSSNSQDDTLAIAWDGDDQRCTSESFDILIDSCVLGARYGNTTPYSSVMEMRVTFQLQWTLLPDSYLSREPAVEVVDRAGQSSYSLLPEMRWRYSPDMMISRSSMNVSIDDSVPNSEGAWVRPGAAASIQGEVMWSSDGLLVNAPVDVAILLDGQRHTVLASGGGFVANLEMPMTSGDHPLNVELANLPTNADDLTDRSTPVMWIVVDGDAPVVTEVLSPRPTAVLTMEDLSELEIEIRVKELEQLNPASMQVNWRIQPLDSLPGTLPVAEGVITPTFMENRFSGQSIPVLSIFDISSVLEDDADLAALELIIWLVGADMAGNQFDDLLNSEVIPLGTWPVEQRAPFFSMQRSDIEYSKWGDLNEGESVTISITVHNSGKLGGQVEILVEVVRPGGTREELDQTSLYIEAGSHNTSDSVWNLNGLGAVWIEATIISTGQIENGPTLRIVETTSDGFFGNSVAGVDAIYIWLAVGLMAVLSIVFVALMRQGGSGETWVDDEDWEEEVANQTAIVDQLGTQKQYPKPPPVGEHQQPSHPSDNVEGSAYTGYVDPYAHGGYQPPPQQ